MENIESLNNQENKFEIPKYFITQNELADIYKISPQGALHFLKSNNIPTFKFGNKTALPPKSARKFLTQRGFKYPNQIIAFQMLKGGSTKTSCAFNTAVRLTQYGAKVLCVDLDMQGNLTDAFDIDSESDEIPVFINLLNGGVNKIEELIVPVSENIDIIPSNFNNSTLDFLITSKSQNIRKLIHSHLSPLLSKYDFIIIDCNPALSALNISVALASDLLVIPVNPDKFSSKGLEKTVEELTTYGNEYSKELNYKLLYTLYDTRESASHTYLAHYLKKYESRVFPTFIRRNTDVKTAIDQKKSIFDFKQAAAREDFDFFVRGILGFQDTKASGNA